MDAVEAGRSIYGGNDSWAPHRSRAGERPSLRCHHDKKADEKEADEERPLSEVLDFLREYHGALGPLVGQFEGTLDQFSGDGIMVFFNDPVPIPDPAERAVKMAVATREVASTLIASWRERGRELRFGVGIAQGYATLGQIGFSERSGYTAIGTVCNVAARLSAEAKDGQILLSQRVNVELKGSLATEQVGALALKGIIQPVVAYNVPLTAIQPALRVIEGGPQSV
jgi:class 3 adenylate cyclase